MGFDLGQFLGLQSKGHVALDPYEQIRPLLRQYATGGFPGWREQWKRGFTEDIVPALREQFEAGKGFGPGSTPFASAALREGTRFGRQLSQQDLMGRLQALMGYGRTPIQFGARATTSGQNLMAMLLPLLSSFLGAGGFFDMSQGGLPTVTGGGGGGGGQPSEAFGGGAGGGASGGAAAGGGGGG